MYTYIRIVENLHLCKEKLSAMKEILENNDS